MLGMDRHTGKPLDGDAHIAQSIVDILTTPIGTRTQRRDYGSSLPELIDAPLTKATGLLLIAATAGALRKWEPRIALSKVTIGDLSAAGRPSISLVGKHTDLPNNPPFSATIAL